MENPSIIVVNFGSQVASLIERSLREIGFRSAVLPPKQAERWIRANKPKAIILSGSGRSVNDPNAPAIAPWIWETDIPILGICYGMQHIDQSLGGSVISNNNSDSEFGPSSVDLCSSELFVQVPRHIDVWTSHGDTVATVPNGFEVIARTPSGAIAAMEDRRRRIFGVQFHPEVTQTAYGKLILSNFVKEIAGCETDWQPSDMVCEIQEQILREVGDGLAIIGFSGGVDSTTLAKIAGPVLGDRLKAVCIDGGQLREGEIEEIRQNAGFAGVTLEVVDAKEAFACIWHKCDITGPPEPELKRKVFREEYRLRLLESATRLGATHFIQGTLAPDMIESGLTGGDCIKTHHNTGVVLGKCVSLHPLSLLFKYEVRALAESLDLPASVVNRKPFPGPGLFIRVKNGWPLPDRLDILRWADKKATDILKAHGLYDGVSQPVIYMPCGQSVGVKGDERVYGYQIVVKGVGTVDFMTAEAIQFPPEVRREITATLTKHPQIVGVAWDETPKPPGTIEPE